MLEIFFSYDQFERENLICDRIIFYKVLFCFVSWLFISNIYIFIGEKMFPMRQQR